MRVTEFFQTIPSFIFAIVLVAILAPSGTSLVIAIAMVSWPPMARLVRGEFLTIKSREFVQAAIVAGQRDIAILRRTGPAQHAVADHRHRLADGRHAILIESACPSSGLATPT